MKTQLKKANFLKAKYVAIIGIMEARRGVCQLKDMSKGVQKEIKLADLLTHMVNLIGEENLDFYDPTKELLRVKKSELVIDNK
jgi:hypothetical protein